MKKYKVLTVEDEHHAQEMLRALLASKDDLELCPPAYSIPEADRIATECKPDLAICDVELPPDNAFDWLRGIGKLPFDVIFLTSFDLFALNAFRLAAVDYLLKPLDPVLLDLALAKFREKRGSGQGIRHLEEMLHNLQQPSRHKKIALPSLTGFVFVPIGQVIRCESDNTYTTFFLSDKKKIIVSRTLKECEQMLESHGFFRIHNSHLINLDYIQEYIKGDGGQVRMEDGSYVDVSRRRKEEFLKIIR